MEIDKTEVAHIPAHDEPAEHAKLGKDEANEDKLGKDEVGKDEAGEAKSGKDEADEAKLGKDEAGRNAMESFEQKMAELGGAFAAEMPAPPAGLHCFLCRAQLAAPTFLASPELADAEPYLLFPRGAPFAAPTGVVCRACWAFPEVGGQELACGHTLMNNDFVVGAGGAPGPLWGLIYGAVSAYHAEIARTKADEAGVVRDPDRLAAARGAFLLARWMGAAAAADHAMKYSQIGVAECDIPARKRLFVQLRNQYNTFHLTPHARETVSDPRAFLALVASAAASGLVIIGIDAGTNWMFNSLEFEIVRREFGARRREAHARLDALNERAAAATADTGAATADTGAVTANTGAPTADTDAATTDTATADTDTATADTGAPTATADTATADTGAAATADTGAAATADTGAAATADTGAAATADAAAAHVTISNKQEMAGIHSAADSAPHDRPTAKEIAAASEAAQLFEAGPPVASALLAVNPALADASVDYHIKMLSRMPDDIKDKLSARDGLGVQDIKYTDKTGKRAVFLRYEASMADVEVTLASGWEKFALGFQFGHPLVAVFEDMFLRARAVCAPFVRLLFEEPQKYYASRFLRPALDLQSTPPRYNDINIIKFACLVQIVNGESGGADASATGGAEVSGADAAPVDIVNRHTAEVFLRKLYFRLVVLSAKARIASAAASDKSR